MNTNCFKTVFSKRLGCLVAVGEHTCSQGKANGASGAAGSAGASLGTWSQFVGVLVAGSAAVGLAWAAPANNALPTGGQVAQGGASISTNGANMNIQQTTAKAVVNWQSFDIGKDAKVNIQQPGADSVMLNRVTGANPSQIFGQLNANGQVVLVNPNGVLFGKDGSVSATSFTASTLGISDANFMAGNMQYERNGSTASVVNQGSIKASGGYVALLGASVSNEGKIETNGGTAYLAAAETVKVPLSGSGRIKLELSPSAINAQVANSKEGTIVTQGGQVYMQAAALQSAVASIIQSGSIDTTGQQGGAVHLLADGGNIKVDGSITANSTGQDDKGQPRKGGDIVIGRDEETAVLAASADVSGARLETNRGFVETSGHRLDVDNTAVKAATWLLDPDNIDITNAATATSGYSKVSASDVSTALNAGANVVIHTTNGVTTSTGSISYTASNPGEGNILVSSAISKTSGGDASLTLTADNGLTVNAEISSSGVGTGKLDINLTANGKTNGTAVASMTATERALSRGLFINAASLNANGGNITLTGTSYADATTYDAALRPFGNSNASSLNAIGKGVQIHNGASLTANNITIAGTAQNQRVQTGMDANSNPVYYTETSYGVVFQRYPTQATLTASGNILVTGTLQGSGNGNGLIFAESGWGAQAPSMTATGNITLRGNNRASGSNTSEAFRVNSGVQALAGGSIVLQGETNNASANAITVYSADASTWGAPGALYGNMTLQATGNVLIQSNQGGIQLNNQLRSTLTNGLLTSENKITGVNITIDNTGAGMTVNGVANANGGSINASTGAITAGTGKATGAGVSGVNLGDNRTITATGNFNLYGASNANAWAVISKAQVTAANFSVQGYNSNPNGTVSGGGLQLKTGASFTGTATSGSNLIKGTWGASQFGSTYGLLVGDSSSSNVSLTSAAGSTLSVEGYNNMTSVLAGNMYYSPGLHTQGVVNTSGTVTLKGYSQVHHGLAINGTLTHTGGALTLDGTSQPFSGYPGSGGSSAGVLLNGILNVNGGNNLTVTGTNKTTNSSNQSGSTAFGVNTASGSQLNGSGGTLSITGLTPMNSGLTAANLPKTQAIYSAGSISGWGNTTLLGQNAANSSLSAVQVVGNINVGNSQLNVLANGGQIYQGSSSTFTASRVTMDNTGAGRISLFTDYSVTPNTALNANYGGNIDVNGKVTTMGSAATTSSSATRGLDLNGAMTTTGDINLATNSGAYINSALTSSTGDIQLQAQSTVTVLKALSAPTASGTTGGNVALKSIAADIELQSNITAGKTLVLDAEGSVAAITQSAGNVVASSLQLLGANAAVTLTSGANNLIGILAGSVKSVALTNQRDLRIDAVNSTVGLTTSGAIDIASTTSTLDASGLWVTQDVKTTGGDITLSGTNTASTGTTSASFGVRIGGGKSVGDSNSGAVSITGVSTLDTGVYVAGSGTTIQSKKLLTLNGTGKTGANVAGNLLSLSGGSDFVGANAISLMGYGATSSNGLVVGGAVQNNSTGGATSLQSTRGALYLSGSVTHGANAKNILVESNGHVSVLGAVSTADTSSSAIVVNAGKSVAAGIASGGDVVVSGSGAFSTGTGGRVTLYTGSVAGSVGLGVSLGNSRYNSDEVASNYTSALGSGVYAVYREAPTLSINVNNASKTYDAAAFSGGNGFMESGATGLKNGDSLSSALSSAVWSGTAQNAVNAGTYTLSASESVAGKSALGYVTTYSSGTLTVNKKDVSLASITAANKTYNGSDAATITAGSITTGVGSQTLLISGSGTFSDKNAADGKTVTVADVTALTRTNGTGDWSNYNLTTTGAMTTTANIAKKDVSLASITAANKAYDGSDAAAITAGAITTGVGSETLLISGSGTFSNKNAADGKTVTVADVTALTKTNGTGDWGNYNLTTTGSMTTTANIAKKDVSLTSITAANKTYDGNDAATITAGTISTGVGTETLLISGSGTFSDKNADINKTVTVADVTALTKTNGTGDWSNYNLITTGAKTTTATIDKATLSAALTGTVEKVYDGTTAASNLVNANFAVTGWVTGEGATVSQTAASYGSKNVSDNSGTGAVSAVLSSSHFTAAAGTLLSNYDLPTTASGNVGKITPASLVVKVNDSAAFVTMNASQATDNGLSYTGFVNGENAASALTGIGTRTYLPASQTPVAGTYTGAFGLSTTPTALHGNYDVTVQKGDLTVVPADKLLISVAGKTETYGVLTAANAGASASTVTAQYCLTSTCATSLVDLTVTRLPDGTWQATDATGTSVTFSTLVDTTGKISTGGFVNVGNYTYGASNTVPPSGTNFNGRVVNGGVLTVEAKTVSLDASGVSKTYDGTTALAGRSVSITNAMGGDLVSAASSGGSFGGKNAGTQSFSLTGLSLSGADSGNYAIATSLNGANGRIDAKALTLTAGSITKTYDGSTSYAVTQTDLDALSLQLVSGDTVTAAQMSFADKNVSRAGNGTVLSDKAVNLNSVTLSDGNSGSNYSLTLQGNQTSTITPKTLQASGAVADKAYDGTRLASLGDLSGAGVVAGDVVTFQASSALFDGKDVLRDASGNVLARTVTVSGLSLSGTDAANYSLSSTSFYANASITPKLLTVSGASVANKTQDGNTLATLSQGTLSGLVGAETLEATATANFDSASAGINKNVTVHYSLADGLNGGLASNYQLLDQVLSASIFGKPTGNPVSPAIVPVQPAGGGSKVVMVKGQAAVGQAAGPMCSIETPQGCECQDALMEEVDVCVVPRDQSVSVAAPLNAQ